MLLMITHHRFFLFSVHRQNRMSWDTSRQSRAETRYGDDGPRIPTLRRGQAGRAREPVARAQLERHPPLPAARRIVQPKI